MSEHKCVLCETELESKEALQEHFRKHANKEIDARGKTVKNKTKPIDTQCDICHQTFPSMTATIRHRFKKHPNLQAKFYCSYCGKRFPLKTHRDNHITSHDASESEKTEQHKKCEECNVTFYNEKALNYHYRSIHKRMVYLFHPMATPPPSNKIRLNSMNDVLSVYYCHLCGVEYVVKFNLQQHLEKSHTKEQREALPKDLIKCTMCSALFCNKKAYDVHNGYHQPNDLYVTSEQQRMRAITRIDQDFDIRRPSKRQRKGTEMEKDKSSEFSDDQLAETNESSDPESDIPLKQRLIS
ncbi:gastrula zinc finger protein XlCGF7.1-like isoform X2 [Pseudomyrmex gracilis]|uniref:gastrula zinc finger protein XlCGF7.1-like isoform X2 n=1 Tax=Pseudomyrmex gracilis TaxID=219809 RepID=UPI0009954445|nr:gastrula zinc finger protein XlCGF7.1-like isoform X2 [Pseudomyrmex gracilis]